MKRCPNCNYENNQVSIYCERCGTFLAPPSATSFPEQTYASVNEAYTLPVDRPATTQEQSYYSSTPPPMQSIYSTPINVPPPSSLYNSPPAPNYSYGIPSSSAPPPERRQRSFGATLLSALLYLLGALCVAFGATGFALHETSSLLIGSVFIVLCLVALLALILLLIFRKHLILRWWMRVLIILVLTIVGTIALAVAGNITYGSSVYPALGTVLVTYGLITAIVAFW